MQLVKQSDGQLMTTSKIVSDVFGKVHRDVVRSIKELKCSDEFRVRNFAQSYYVSPQNKKLQCYEMTRDGFSILCMGFTGNKAMEWKEKYINAFFGLCFEPNSTLNPLSLKLLTDSYKLSTLYNKWLNFIFKFMN